MVLGEIHFLGVVYYNIISDPECNNHIHTSYNCMNYKVKKEEYELI
jgi:hypothetical protein